MDPGIVPYGRHRLDPPCLESGGKQPVVRSTLGQPDVGHEGDAVTSVAGDEE